MSKLLYFFVFWVLIGCHEKGKEAGNLMRIDLEEEYSKKEIDLQDIADVEYIPLETRPDVLLDGNALGQICMSDSLIVTRSNSAVFIFNRRGEYVHSFERKGRGGEEYSVFGKMAVDFIREEIYINDITVPKICVYGFDGSCRRVLKLPTWSTIHLLDYNPDFLLGCFKESIGLTGKADKQPYWLISKEDGEISPLPLTFQERVLSAAILYYPNRSMEYLVWPLNSIVKNGKEFLIADFGTDTIYNLSGDTLTPYLLKSPSRIWKKDPHVMGYIEFKTNRYVGMKFMELSWEKNALNKKILYDLSTGSKVEYDFLNRDFQPAQKVFISWNEADFDLPSGYLKFKLLPIKLKNDYDAGKLTGKLKEIASTLEEDANPVLMLVKFRE